MRLLGERISDAHAGAEKDADQQPLACYEPKHKFLPHRNNVARIFPTRRAFRTFNAKLAIQIMPSIMSELGPIATGISPFLLPAAAPAPSRTHLSRETRVPTPMKNRYRTC
jgi:hypothetical protein